MKFTVLFDSGASAGYLNQRYYDVKIDDERYIERFRKIVRDSFHHQAGDSELLSLVFNRIYIVGVKARQIEYHYISYINTSEKSHQTRALPRSGVKTQVLEHPASLSVAAGH